MAEIICHLIGDYILQSDWMANEKTKRFSVAVIHGIFYTIPFLFLTQELWKLAVIAGSHAIIDRTRCAKYIVWLKNYLLTPPTFPEEYYGNEIEREKYVRPWSECTATGYPDSRPAWLTVWLMIIADNTLHIVINHLVLSR